MTIMRKEYSSEQPEAFVAIKCVVVIRVITCYDNVHCPQDCMDCEEDDEYDVLNHKGFHLISILKDKN